VHRHECEEIRLKLQPLLPSLLLTGSVAVLVAQPAWADVVQVTEVQLNPTASGLEVILKTASGASPQVFTTTDKQTLLIDVNNAQLNLPEGREFRSDNPIQGITSVTVTPVTTNSIRVTVTGSQALPKAEVTPNAQGLVLGISVPVTTASQTPQNPPQGETEAPTEAPTVEEEIEIVVTGEQEQEGSYRVPDATTATRTDTPLRDTPQSIQVVPQQVLEDQQVTRVEEAVRNVSGVFQGNTAGGATTAYVIRGFEQLSTLQDGFVLSDYGSPETANLERIEVLKGPASILYGATEPGGVVNLVTKKPLSEPFFEAEFQAGSYSFIRPRFDISGPLNSDKSLLYRLNAAYERSDGFRDFDQGIERIFIGPAVTWKISDRTDVTFELSYLDDERPLDRGIPAIGEGIADIPITRILGEPDDVIENRQFTAKYQLEHRFSENWTVRNAFQYFNEQLDVSNFDPDIFEDNDGTLARNQRSIDQHSESFSLQTNLVGKFATGPVKHTLLFGVDLTHRPRDVDFALGLSNPAPINIFNPVYGLVPRVGYSELDLLLSQSTKTDSVGIYVQDQITLTDNLKLLLGGRFDIVDQTIKNNPSAFEPTSSSSSQYNEAFSPRVGIVYQPIEPLSLYASYSRSFRPNEGTTFDGSLLEPERGTQYEVGAKADLLGGRLSTTLSFYQITKTNVATVDINNPDFVIASGEQRSQGIELDIAGEILPNWKIIASYAYTDAEVTKDNSIPVGNRLNNIPEHSASLWTTYEIPRGGLQGLGFGIGFTFVGERKGDIENTFELPSYFLTNGTIYYRRDNWRAALIVKNLFDVGYFESSTGVRERGAYPGAPLTILGSISVEF
jgi:iron complex outermembrane recepter protein